MKSEFEQFCEGVESYYEFSPRSSMYVCKKCFTSIVGHHVIGHQFWHAQLEDELSEAKWFFREWDGW